MNRLASKRLAYRRTGFVPDTGQYFKYVLQDGDFEYLESRINAIESKPVNDDTKPYYAAIPLLKKLKAFLISNENIPQPIEEQVLYVTEEFYINPEHNKMFFKLPKA